MDLIPTQPPYQVTAAQTEIHNESSSRSGLPGSRPIFPTPVWYTAVRGFRLVIAFVIMILAGLLMHGLVIDEVAFALVCGLFTFIVDIWGFLSEKVPGCQAAYNYWAILSLDLGLAIFWLASMGAVAALRGTFTVSVNAECTNNGQALNSNHCTIYKRAAVANQGGLAMMSAIAGLSTLMMLLFIATLIYLGHQIRLHIQAKKAAKAARTDNAIVEMKAQAEPMLSPETQVQYAAQPYSTIPPTTTAVSPMQTPYAGGPQELYAAYDSTYSQQEIQRHQQAAEATSYQYRDMLLHPSEMQSGDQIPDPMQQHQLQQQNIDGLNYSGASQHHEHQQQSQDPYYPHPQ